MTETPETTGNYALNQIRHGNEDGTLTIFEPGDVVTLDEKYLEQLRASDAVGDLPKDATKIAASNEELRAQVEELQAKLEAALGGNPPQEAPVLTQ